MNDQEIEARFLGIDTEKLIEKLHVHNAKDLGEDFLEEIIFYDKELSWVDQHRFVRIRKNKNGIFLAYKHQHAFSVDGTKELELIINDFEVGTKILEELGLIAYRHQEKKRHTFKLHKVTIDIDTWPNVPTYVELEGETEQQLKDMAKLLGIDWKDAVFENPRIVIEKYYKIPVSKFRFFTFDRIE